MRVLHKEFDTYFSNYSYIAEKLRRTINTYYIPLGDDIQEVITDFTKIQMNRSFTEGFSKAYLALSFDEDGVTIRYVSTSNTEVNIKLNVDSQMKFSSGIVSVDIPDDRAVPGRRHYEEITKEFYEFSWHLGSPPPEGVDEDALPPEWLRDKESNKTSLHEREEELKVLGYEKVHFLGFLNAWKHSGSVNVKYHLVVETTKNEFKLVKEGKLIYSSYTVFSWRRLTEVLKQHNQPKADYEDEEHEYDCEGDYVDWDDDDEEQVV